MRIIKNKRLFIFILIIIMLLTLQTVSFADVGSFDRYDSGSSSDWGSSSSSWDSGYSYGVSDGMPSGVWIIIVIIVIIVFYAMRNKNIGGNAGINSNIPKPPVMTNNPTVDLTKSKLYAEKIKEIDPNFSEEKMIAYAKDLYIKLQNAWTARDWEPMRTVESQDLFEQHSAQIQNYINTNRINVVDRIAVNFAALYGFRQEGDRDILEIALKATKKDYIIDAKTKAVLEGNMYQDRITTYKLTFERKTGVLTQEGTADVKTTNCPNCGAPTKITSAGKCPYCGSVITIGTNSWVLSGLEPLR